MILETYASGSGALSFVWRYDVVRHGQRQAEASGEAVARADAMTLLRPGYELFNEGSETRPQWVQLPRIERHPSVADQLILGDRIYDILPAAAGTPHAPDFALREEDGPHRLHHLSRQAALRYYLKHELRILAQRAATSNPTPTPDPHP